MTDVWRTTGFAMVIYLAGPAGHSRASSGSPPRSTGPAYLRRQRHITFPLLAASFNVNFILSLIGTMKVFVMVLVLTNGGPGYATEVFNTYVYGAFSLGRYGYATASNLLLFLAIGAIGIPLPAVPAGPGGGAVKRAAVSRSLVQLAAVLLAAVVVVPFLVIVLNSLKNVRESALFGLSLPTEWRWDNYLAVLSRAHIGRGFRNSIVISAFTVVVDCFAAALAAFVIQRRDSRPLRFTYYLFILGLIVPVSIIPTIRLMMQLAHPQHLPRHRAVLHGDHRCRSRCSC